MIITCPACKAQAQLPDSKEGAKVRCGECGRIYRATSGGRKARAAGQSDPTKYFIIGGAALVVVLLFLVVRGAKDGETEPEPETKIVTEAPEKEPTDWKSPAVQAAVKIHNLAFQNNAPLLRAQLSGPLLLAAMPLAEGEAPKDFRLLPINEQTAILDAAVQDILEGDLVRDWEPFDGYVVPPDQWEGAMPDHAMVVRVHVSPRDLTSDLGNRYVEWHLEKNGPLYKVFGWKRWISPEESEAKAKGAKPYEQKTLSDGSKVIEGVIRPIPYMEETTAEERTQIEALIDQLVDPDNNKIFKVRKELAAIGKPAIPGLLTRMASIPPETPVAIEQLNLIHKTLYDITGHPTTFNLDLMGATAERQESGLKQWFGWYDRRFKRFTQREEAAE
ncbi:MAG: zinc-ribbon domain-containing protein [Planctomycetes bacterium]|nr:zinc-ribbon domain-containing protein [Planctomycetota bacterium]